MNASVVNAVEVSKGRCSKISGLLKWQVYSINLITSLVTSCLSWVFGLSGPRPSVPGPQPSWKFQQAQPPPSQSPVTMIMCTLLSMVYELFKPCRLTHDTKDIGYTVLLFNVHLSFFVDSILHQTEKYMSKVNNKQIRLICWMCSKLKVNTVCHRSGVFVADFDHNQHVNILLLLLTLNKYLLAGCEIQVIMFWKQKNWYICFVPKVASFLSINNLFIIAPNWKKLWTYDQCFSSKFALKIPSVSWLFRPVLWSAPSSLIARDLTWTIFAWSNWKPI